MSSSKRIRRTPEDARRVILDAAEASMAKSGPAGIRLQEVARAAGVSHPTILHHFQNREGLIQALNQRAVEDLKTVLQSMMTPDDASPGAAVRAAFAAYRNGFAQRIAWMLQSETLMERPGLGLFDQMVDGLHRLRQELSPPGAALDRADSQAVVHLISISAFGDALIGPRLRRAESEAEDQAMRDRFETWLGDLIRAHLRGDERRP